jgi:hypothetical protein
VTDVVLVDGDVVAGSFEQSVFHHGEDRPELPAVEEVGSTQWYEQLKMPVVACRFTVRGATGLELADDYEDDPVWGVEWRPAEGRLVFGGTDAVAVSCAAPNLEITASDRVVGHRRLRRWRLLNRVHSESPWQGD